jgi:hypothetical protein
VPAISGRADPPSPRQPRRARLPHPSTRTPSVMESCALVVVKATSPPYCRCGRQISFVKKKSPSKSVVGEGRGEELICARQSSVVGLLSGSWTSPSRWRHGPGGDGGRGGWVLASRGPCVRDQWPDGWAGGRRGRVGGRSARAAQHTSW